MNATEEHLAWLLAAEEHPHLKKEAGYEAARDALRDSPELKADLNDALAFARRHPRLLGFDRLPADARDRIAKALNAASSSPAPLEHNVINGPWTVRRQFAWAAMLVLLLAGISLMSSKILETQNSEGSPRPMVVSASLLPEFHRFVSQTTANGITLDHEADQPMELVHWLSEHQAQVPRLPDALARGQGRGCTVVESPHGRVSLVCVSVEGQTMHLFVACAKALRSPPKGRERIDLDGRPAIEWVEGNQVYLLTPADPGAEMPEILL